MKLGNLQLVDRGPGFGALLAPTGVVLVEGRIARCTAAWLRYEEARTVVLNERRERTGRGYPLVGATVGADCGDTWVDYLTDTLDPRD